MQYEALICPELATQEFNKVPVDLDGIQGGCRALQQEARERPTPGADLDEVVARQGVYGCDDAVEYTGVMQEVLTESLASAHVSEISGW
jgi:hypothetical protein